MMGQLFQKGSRWTHRNLGFQVYIYEVADTDTFRLNFVDQDRDVMANYLIKGDWSAVELIRSFKPHYQPTVWTRLLEDGLFDD